MEALVVHKSHVKEKDRKCSKRVVAQSDLNKLRVVYICLTKLVIHFPSQTQGPLENHVLFIVAK